MLSALSTIIHYIVYMKVLSPSLTGKEVRILRGPAAVKEEDKAYATGNNPGKALLSDEA